MFEWLFNYPANLWQDSELVLASGWPLFALLLVVLAVLVVLAIVLWKRSLRLHRKLMVFGLQAVVSATLLLMLWQPALQVQVSAPGENTIAWVLDTSASMGIVDVPDGTGSADARQSRFVAGASLISEFADDATSDFDASLYHLGSDLVRADAVQNLNRSALSSRSQLADGLDALLSTVNESALAAVVLLSDGSDNSGKIDAQWWQRLSAAGIPIHTVGMGETIRTGDIQLSDVSLPESAAPDTQITARLRIVHDSGGIARVRVFSGDDLIAAQDVDLPDSVGQSVHLVSIPSGDSGIQQLTFDVRSQHFDVSNKDPEPVNNAQPRILRVSDTPRRILYVEGEPRWEYKFLRRALENHAGVEIVSLLRTSPNKFYRQGVKNASELANGFPQGRAALYAYDAIIIGSFEAVELSTEQQIALRDFVSVRGGSLLMLGGRHGLADGGWGRSVVAPALPVVLSSKLNANTFERKRVQVTPSLSGYRTPWLQLDDSSQANVLAWQGLPELADVQTLGAVKPGAVVLLTHQLSGGGQSSEPLLVTQRYGRGQSVVLGTSGTWRWQMGLPSEDQSHERFWQQLAGMLVEPVLPRLLVDAGNAVYRDNETAAVKVTAFNPDYTPLSQAQLPVQVTLPDGSVSSLSLEADAQLPGVYTGNIPTELDGPYSITTLASVGGESPQAELISAERWWVRESGTAESFDSAQQVDFLRRISDATGGQYLSFEDSDQLLDVLSEKNVALKRDQQLPLWNMPFFFLTLLLAKLTEWLLRMRWKRL